MNRRGFVARMLGAIGLAAGAPAIAHQPGSGVALRSIAHPQTTGVLRGGLAGEMILPGDMVMMAPNGIWFRAQSGMEHKHIGVALTPSMALQHIDVQMDGVARVAL